MNVRNELLDMKFGGTSMRKGTLTILNCHECNSLYELLYTLCLRAINKLNYITL